MRTIGVLGVPSNSAGAIDGVARGPIVLREEGLVDILRRHAEVHDYGDVRLPDPSPARDARSHVIDPDGLGALVARESPRAQCSPVPARDGNYGIANVSWWVLVGRRHSPAGRTAPQDSRKDPRGGSACLPAPVTMSFRKGTPSARRRSTSASMSFTTNSTRFQPPGPGFAPSGIGRPAELDGR